MAKQKILMKKGYPTSDDQMFPTLQEAMAHQSELDLNDLLSDTTIGDDADLKAFLLKNKEAVIDFIKYNQTKPDKKKRAVKKKQAPASDGGEDPVL